MFLGSLLGDTSPVTTFSPLVGAELALEPGASVELDVDPSYEHGVLVDTGVIHLDGIEVHRSSLAYVAVGATSLALQAGPAGSRVLLIGGAPFGEPIVMWWNFVGRTHDEVVASREAWQAQLEHGYEDGRFGVPVGNEMAAIPAPPLPNVRLKERH